MSSKTNKKPSEEHSKSQVHGQSPSCDSINAKALTYLDVGALSHRRVLQTKVHVGLTLQGVERFKTNTDVSFEDVKRIK